MFLMILGLALWSAVHLAPCYLIEPRQRVIDRIGEGPWKAVAALLLVLSIVLMVQGWGPAAAAGVVWTPPSFMTHINNLLMLVAFLLFGAGHAKSNIRRFIRHPQLAAVKVWALAHLLANGEVRSILLFGGLLAWAVVNMIALNKRDGKGPRPEPSPLRNDIRHVAISLVMFVAFLLIHPWLFGVSPLPG
jgi:uncharacterized membrane protein